MGGGREGRLLRLGACTWLEVLYSNTAPYLCSSRQLKHEGVETFSVLSGAFGVDWNSAFRAVVLSGSEASLPGVETAIAIEFASGKERTGAQPITCRVPCDLIWVGRRDRARGEPKEILMDRSDETCSFSLLIYRYNYELRSEFIGLTYYNSSYEIMWPLGRRADRTHTLISGTLFDPKG